MKSFFNFFSLFSIIFISSCSGPGRYSTEKEEYEISSVENEVRLLIDESKQSKEIVLNADSFLFSESKSITLFRAGEVLHFSLTGNDVSLKVKNNLYEASYFQLLPADNKQLLEYNEIKLRGKIKIINSAGSVMVINSIDIESYLKGVIPKEMPLGKGDENYEALKAFAICARTYTLTKIKPRNSFDLFVDVRDQVYGGVEVEKPISNKAVDETKSLILTFNGKPAVVFYHSTCGGHTENVKNIFGKDSIYNLSGIQDGDNPYCAISPSFNWEEIYTPEIFIERLKNAGLVSSGFNILKNVYIVSRFESGRVNELRIELSSLQSDEIKSFSIYGNNIRSIIRTANNKGILKSIWFDITFDKKNNIVITGKGYGHGVGLCQWGTIGQSRAGKNFKEILSHYFPGVKISYIKEKLNKFNF